MKKDSHDKIVAHINRKNWWHVPPQDSAAYSKRSQFFASSFGEAEVYGRPLDTPQRVVIAKPSLERRENHGFKYTAGASVAGTHGARFYHPASALGYTQWRPQSRAACTLRPVL